MQGTPYTMVSPPKNGGAAELLYPPAMRLALAVLLAASSAAAAVPDKGEGTITLLGGMRGVFPGNGGYLTEQGASHQVLQPAGMVSFGYQYDEDLHFKIEVGYAIDRYRIAGGDLRSGPVPSLFASIPPLWGDRPATSMEGGGFGSLLTPGP